MIFPREILRETSLQSFAVSDWLGANLESALLYHKDPAFSFMFGLKRAALI